jgi:hypothetical protein
MRSNPGRDPGFHLFPASLGDRLFAEFASMDPAMNGRFRSLEKNAYRCAEEPGFAGKSRSRVALHFRESAPRTAFSAFRALDALIPGKPFHQVQPR